jgi:WD40 repeat protein
VQTGQCLSNLEGHENEVYTLAFSPDGRLLASGSTGRRIRLWDLRADKQVRILIGHSDYIDALAFSPDGRTLASASRDATVKLWSVSSGRELLSFDLAGVDSEELLAFSPDGKTLALGFETADCNAELLIWPAFAGSSPTDNQANAH